MHYYAYRSIVRNENSYSLLPLSNDAVFVDGIFSPSEVVLALITRASKERFQITPKLNAFGEAEKSQGKEKVERVRIETNYEYYLHNPKDLEWFATNYIVNSGEFLPFMEECFQKKAEAQKKPELHQEQETI